VVEAPASCTYCGSTRIVTTGEYLTEVRLLQRRVACHPLYAIMQRLVERIAQAGRLTTDPETAARAIGAASNGVLMSFLQVGDPAEIGQTADLMFDGLMLRMVRNRCRHRRLRR